MHKPTDNIQVDKLLETYIDRFKQHATNGTPRKVKATPTLSNVVQLPLWPEATRATPNAVLRSALFGAIGRGNRKAYMKPTPLASLEGTTILGMGVQLDQADLDVWQMALHLSRATDLGDRLEFSAKAFLKAIGRADGKANRTWLKESLTRLQGFSIEVATPKCSYIGSLLHEFYVDTDTSRYILSINPRLKNLFDAGWTQIDFDERQSLKGKPLALWLASFYATHAKPFPIKIDTLRTLSGSTASIREFRRVLFDALDACIEAETSIKGYEVLNDKLYVTRTPSDSQNRHLLKKATSKPKKPKAPRLTDADLENL